MIVSPTTYSSKYKAQSSKISSPNCGRFPRPIYVSTQPSSGLTVDLSMALIVLDARPFLVNTFFCVSLLKANKAANNKPKVIRMTIITKPMISICPLVEIVLEEDILREGFLGAVLDNAEGGVMRRPPPADSQNHSLARHVPLQQVYPSLEKIPLYVHVPETYE